MIYLDNAATTPVAPRVLEAMLPYFTEEYGNAGTMYRLGRQAKKAVSAARRDIAATLGAEPDEIYFTAGGTESDNWAIKSVAEAFGFGHIITTKIEHPAVLRTCGYLEKKGFAVTYVDVDAFGTADPERIRAAIRPDTILISVMHANNEIGTLQPISRIGEIAAAHGILFHTDAVQSYGQLPLHVDDLHVDMLSASGHKFNGPKGVGFLYVKNTVSVGPFLHGGEQERKRRAGTENVPAIVGMGEAARLAYDHIEDKIRRETAMRDYLIKRITEEIPRCRLNGHPTKRLPGNVNFSFDFVQGEALLIRMDREGICVSGGSACTSGALEPSHVLLAIGQKDVRTYGPVRMSLSEENTVEELDETVCSLKEIVADLRSMT